MIDATQLPRTPSKSAAAVGSDLAGTGTRGVVSAVQLGPTTVGGATVQAYPAKDLTLVDGRYRAVEQQK